MEDGMNEKGLAVGMTFIYSKEKHLGINAGMIVKILLEQCKSVDEAILLLKKMRIGSAQTFTLAKKALFSTQYLSHIIYTQSVWMT